VTADDSKEENSVREVGYCVKGSRIRNPVPPPTAVEDVLLANLSPMYSTAEFSSVQFHVVH